MRIPKKDQEILNKYFKGKTIKKTWKTPYVRSYAFDGDEACIRVSSPKLKEFISGKLTSVAIQKGWNLRFISNGNDLICLLTS